MFSVKNRDTDVSFYSLQKIDNLKKFKLKSKSGARVLNLHSDWTAEQVQLEAVALVRTQHFFLSSITYN